MKAISVPFRPLLDRVPRDHWPQVDAEVCREVARYSDGENIAFGASVVLASGRKYGAVLA
jgi:hypothetical protein